MRSPRPLHVTAIGCVTWDTFLLLDRPIQPGTYAVITHQAEYPGGTTANVCVALHRLGCIVRFASVVGDDEAGEQLRVKLQQHGLPIDWIQIRPQSTSDQCFVLVSPGSTGPERTILWIPGARPRYGDVFPINDLLSSDALIVDVDDERLRRFLLDLPSHVAPRTRLIGLLPSLLAISHEAAQQLALQHDVLIGNEAEILQLTGASSIEQAIATLQQQMPLWGMRLGAISRSQQGCTLFTAHHVAHIPALPVDPIDVTGAGDAFAAGIVYGFLCHWDLERIGWFANAMGALATRALGAQSGLPTLAEIGDILEQHGPAHIRFP